MSFVSPIYIEDQVNDTLLMGIIFSFSSVVGVICDFIFPKIFQNQPHFFFLKTTIITALAFPFTFIFIPQHLVTLLVAMAVWGIYYELQMFSSFHFINTYVNLHDHTKAWGIIQALQSSAYALAPLLAIKLLDKGFKPVFSSVFFFLGIAIFGALLFKYLFVKKDTHNLASGLHPIKKSWASEFKIWKVLLKKVWPLYILQLLINSMDASFWTIGTLFTEQLSDKHYLGNFFIPAFIAPSVFVGFVLGKVTFPFGKKRAALICSAIAGMLFMTFYFLQYIPLLIGTTFFASLFLSIASPYIRATFEDYVGRLGNNSNDMIGLQASSTSLGFIIGPIVASYLAQVFDIQKAFALIGGSLAIVAVLLLFVTPKKIKMPKNELAKIESISLQPIPEQ